MSKGRYTTTDVVILTAFGLLYAAILAAAFYYSGSHQAKITGLVEGATQTGAQLELAEAMTIAEQADTAHWTRIIAIATALGIPISAIALFGLLGTLRETRQANALARKAIAENGRAWLRISIDGGISGEFFPDGYLRLLTGVYISNHGEGVAKDVKFASKIVHYRPKGYWPTEDDLFAEENKLKGFPYIGEDIPPTIFKGGDCSPNVQLMHIERPYPTERGFHYIVLRVEYRLALDSVDDPPRFTEAIYTITHTNGQDCFVLGDEGTRKGNQFILATRRGLSFAPDQRLPRIT